MVDDGINGKNLNIITLILLAQLGFFIATLSIDYIRSWILLHINSRIDISLIADFLIKLTAMPLQFFDSRMTGDILQRIGDHSRIKNFMLGNSMRIVFSLVNFTQLSQVNFWCSNSAYSCTNMACRCEFPQMAARISSL